jgi:hypothetical protein
MRLFGKRRQEERDNVKAKELDDMEKAIAVISARLRFLEALTSHLVVELPPKKRDSLLEQVRDRRWTGSPSTTDTRTPLAESRNFTTN